MIKVFLACLCDLGLSLGWASNIVLPEKYARDPGAEFALVFVTDLAEPTAAVRAFADDYQDAVLVCAKGADRDWQLADVCDRYRVFRFPRGRIDLTSSDLAKPDAKAALANYVRWGRYQAGVYDFTRPRVRDFLFESPWIGDGEPDREEETFYDKDPASEFQAAFVLPEGAGETTVTIACAGHYALALNGRKSGVSATSLMPLWSPFDRTIYADSFTARVSSGELLPHPATNVVSVTLGNGFYNLPPLRFSPKSMTYEPSASVRTDWPLAVPV